jgi:hypothetical protein
VDTNKLKMAKESGKGANSYKLGEKPKVKRQRYIDRPGI